METGRVSSFSRRQLDSDDKVDSPNLRDFLRIKEDENSNYNVGQTLGSALSAEKMGAPPQRTQSNRTLLDVIREDPQGGNNGRDGKRSWKHFREKLRLRRQGSGSSWTSSVPVPTSDIPINQNSRMMSRRDSTRLNMPISDGSSNMVVELTAGTGLPRTRSALLQRNASRAIERGSFRYDSYSYSGGPNDADEVAQEATGESTEEEEGEAAAEGEDGGGEEVGEGEGEEGEEPVRMSLMALLAETDREMGLDGSSYMMEDDDEDDEDEEEEKGGDAYSACCVCMVRHKGAAFIPCGHTFCRLCSRELWVQRGNCPLCNNFILEILDIF